MKEEIPNAISYARIGLGLAFPFVPPEARPWVIAAAAASDGLDGLIARHWQLGSDTGILLDPIADKIFVVILVGTLIVEGTLPIAWAIGLAARDLVVAAGTLLVVLRIPKEKRKPMRPNWLGKTTTVAQFLVLLVAVLQGSAPAWLLAAATAISLASALSYGMITRSILKTS